MVKQFLLLCFIAASMSICNAQTITITNVTPDTVAINCNPTVTVTFTTTGTFQSGNQFILGWWIDNNDFYPFDTITLGNQFTFTWTYGYYIPKPLMIQSTNPVALSNLSDTIHPVGLSEYLINAPDIADSKACYGTNSTIPTYTPNLSVWYHPMGTIYDWHYLDGTPVTPTYQSGNLTLSFGVRNHNDTVILYRTLPNSYTCVNFKYDTIIIKVNEEILPGLDTIQSACFGQPIHFNYPSVQDYRFQWYNSSGSTLLNTGNSFTALVDTTTQYYLNVGDTVAGCSKLFHVTAQVNAPPIQDICLTTVDSNSTHNVIVWEKDDLSAIDSFFIYKETAANVYTRIADIHKDSLSRFDDYTSNPNITSSRYKITTYDTCRNELLLSNTNYHNTIHLQYLNNGNLQWSAYEVENSITPITTYSVFKDALSNGNWQLLVTVSGTQLTVTDTGYNLTSNPRYRVIANMSNNCGLINQSLSNIQSISTTGFDIIHTTSFTLSPNPVNDLVQVTGCVLKEAFIIDLAGNRIEAKFNALNQIDASQLQQGSYILQVNGNGESQYLRFVKL